MKHYYDLIPRYLKMQMKKTLLTMIGIILSVALITSIGAISESVKYALIENEKDIHGDYHAYYENLNTETIEALRMDTRLSMVGTSISLGNYDIPDKSLNIGIEGYDASAYELMQIKLLTGHYPIEDDEIVLEEWALEVMDLDLELGQVIPIAFKTTHTDSEKTIHTYEGEKSFRLAGILENNRSSKLRGVSFGFVSQNAIYNLIPAQFISYKTSVKVVESAPIRNTLQALQREMRISDEQVNLNENLLRTIGETKEPNYVLLLLVSIVLISSIAIIYSVFYISVLERIRQFGMLKTVGAEPRHIRKIVFGEALVLAIFAIPIGILMGSVLSKLLIGAVASLITIELSELVISQNNMIIAGILGVISVFISAYSPVMLASKVSPMEALRVQSTFLSNKNSKLSSPSFVQKIGGLRTQMAYRNLWRNRRKASITIFSMSLGIILFIVFGFYTENLSNSNKLDDYIAGDYKIIIEGNTGYDVGYSEDDYNHIQSLDGVEWVYKTQYTNAMFTKFTEDTITDSLKAVFSVFKEPETNSYNTASNLFGYTENNLEKLTKHIVGGDIDTTEMARENVVLITESIRGLGSESKVKTGLNVGDEIIVRKVNRNSHGKVTYGEDVKLIIGGVLKDIPTYRAKTVLGLTIIAHQNIFEKITGSQTYQRLDIKASEGSDRDLLSESLNSIASRIPLGTFISLEDEINKSLLAQKNIKLLGSILVGAVILIGGINVINIVSTNLILRESEFGMLRAVGISISSIKKTVIIEGGLYGVIGGTIGAVIGNIVVYVLYYLMKDQFDLVWVIPWKETFIAVLGGIALGTFSTLVPLSRISQKSIIESVRIIE